MKLLHPLMSRFLPASGSLAATQTALPKRDMADLKRVNKVFVPLLVIAGITTVLLASTATHGAAIVMWALASLVTGGALGFLFGIPRSRRYTDSSSTGGSPQPPEAQGSAPASQKPPRPPAAAAHASPNTNLEEISDWVTKIIVGLSLVHAQDLEKYVQRIAANAAAAFNAQPSSSDVSGATAVVMAFFVMGFLASYLYTRLFLQAAMSDADRLMNENFLITLAYAEGIARREQKPVDDDDAAVPSEATRRAAALVASTLPSSDPSFALQPLLELASEYEGLRSRMPEFGPERTRAMSEIVTRMRPYAIAAADYFGTLAKSTSPGERLAAVVIQSMKLQPENIEWLAQRLVDERSFIGYQAASALLDRARSAGMAEATRIKEAVQAAKEGRAKLGISEAQLDKMIDRILAVS